MRPRLVQILTKAAPGLSMSQLMKWGGLRDRKAFKAWVLDRLAEAPPNRLIPVHGEILDADDLPDRVRALLAQRL